jgi:hypothetical protein
LVIGTHKENIKQKEMGGGGRINERETFEKKNGRRRGRIKERERENKREGEGE